MTLNVPFGIEGMIQNSLNLVFSPNNLPIIISTFIILANKFIETLDVNTYYKHKESTL